MWNIDNFEEFIKRLVEAAYKKGYSAAKEEVEYESDGNIEKSK